MQSEADRESNAVDMQCTPLTPYTNAIRKHIPHTSYSLIVMRVLKNRTRRISLDRDRNIQTHAC
jgi:hypothetical protein